MEFSLLLEDYFEKSMKSKLLSIVFFLFIVVMNAAMTMSVSGEVEKSMLMQRDGLVLFGGGVEKSKDGHLLLRFILENTNTYPIRFVDNGRSNRFSFRMLDENGREIKPLQEWWQRNDPYASDVGMRAVSKIESGGDLSFTLNLGDAYGNGGLSGAVLEVRWEPEDGNDGLFKVGWELKGDFDLFPFTGKTLASKSKSGIPASDSGLRVPKRAPLEDKEPRIQDISKAINKDTTNQSPMPAASTMDTTSINTIGWLLLALIAITGLGVYFAVSRKSARDK